MCICISLTKVVREMILFRYELRKILLCKRGLIVFIIIVLQLAICFVPKEYEHSYSIEVYKRYLEEFGGEYTEETRAILKKDLDEAETVITIHEKIINQYHNDIISSNEFNEHNDAYNKALAEKPTIEYLLNKCEYFDTLNKQTEFFYDTDWEDLIKHDSFEYLIALCLCIIIIPAFCNEYSSESFIIIKSTQNGRYKTARAKLIICIGFIFVFSFIMCTFRAFPLIIHDEDSIVGYPIYNIMNFDFKCDMSIGVYFLIDCMLKALSWATLAAFVCLISVFIKNETIIYFISFIIILCPALLFDFMSSNVLEYLFCAYSLASHLTPDTSILLPFVMMIKLLLYSVFTSIIWCKEKT